MAGITHSIFIVGCPRSGTTLLQSLLACCSGVTTFLESHFFDRSLARCCGAFVPRRDADCEIDRFWADNMLPFEQRPPRRPLFGKLTSRAVADMLTAALVAAGQARNAQVILEKTPRHLHYIGPITSAWARQGIRVSFVHIVRDGVAVAASLIDSSANWPRPRAPSNALARWHADLDHSVRYLGQEGHLFVTYEALASAPQGTCMRLAEALGLRLSEDDLRRRSEMLGRIVRSDETWKMVGCGDTICRSERARTHVDAATLAALEGAVDRSAYRRIHAHITGRQS
jgi:hypothetical protein